MLKGEGNLAKIGDVYFGGLEVRSFVGVSMTEEQNPKIMRNQGHSSGKKDIFPVSLLFIVFKIYLH